MNIIHMPVVAIVSKDGTEPVTTKEKYNHISHKRLDIRPTTLIGT